ncbi:MAG: hypothetical protein ABWY56_07920 [Propionibacteriaceae bacterium]
MHYLIAWSGFLGAWLLVAGPMYQAVLELDEEDFERDVLSRATATVPPPPRSSPWWWLLPPVAYVLQRRQSQAYRRAVMDALPPESIKQLVRFKNMATGWAFVAFGAFFIAVKETWELQEVYEWPIAVFWVLLVVLVVLCTLNTAVRTRNSHRLTDGPAPA